MIADHGIQRVDRLVQHTERRAADQHEHQRRHHAVGQVLRHGFDRRLDDALLGQRGGIAADVPRNGLATLLQRLLDCAVYMITGVRKAFPGEDQPAEQRFRRKSQPEVHSPQPEQGKKRHSKADPAGDDPE